MPDAPLDGVRLLTPAQVADMLQLSADEVVALAMDGRLRGVRLSAQLGWRIEEQSVAAYLDEQAEDSRRFALWRQSNAASFPELWGRGSAR